jgi:hypothetical protein
VKSPIYLKFTIPLFIIMFNQYFNFDHIFVNNIFNFKILFNHSNQSGNHRDDKVQIPNLYFCIFFPRLI